MLLHFVVLILIGAAGAAQEEEVDPLDSSYYGPPLSLLEDKEVEVANLTGVASRNPFSYNNIHVYAGHTYSNILISAPHGGAKRVSGYGTRTRGCYRNSRCYWGRGCSGKKIKGKCGVLTQADSDSDDLAIAIRQRIYELTWRQPHMVVSGISRAHMDPNRERDEGSQGIGSAERMWDTYHYYIDYFRKQITSYRGSGIIFDIHGYSSHKDNWVELGYLIYRSDLNARKIVSSKSSIRSLDRRSPYSITQLLQSSGISLGSFIQSKGLTAVPSPQYRRPADGSDGGYYRGGYITQTYGSRSGGSVDAIQIETPPYIRDNPQYYGRVIGDAIVEWMNLHYNN